MKKSRIIRMLSEVIEDKQTGKNSGLILIYINMSETGQNH